VPRRAGARGRLPDGIAVPVVYMSVLGNTIAGTYRAASCAGISTCGVLLHDGTARVVCVLVSALRRHLIDDKSRIPVGSMAAYAERWIKRWTPSSLYSCGLVKRYLRKKKKRI